MFAANIHSLLINRLKNNVVVLLFLSTTLHHTLFLKSGGLAARENILKHNITDMALLYGDCESYIQLLCREFI